jgi:hypothetical protein
VAVGAAAASQYTVSAPAAATAGSGFSATVTALDPYGNVATAYAGTVHFTSTDANAILPADYTFTATDAGSHVFTVTLQTTGTQRVTAQDSASPTIVTTTSGIPVTAGVSLSLSVPQTATAGSAFNVVLTVADAHGNAATGYTGTVHFTSTDAHALVPADYTFTATDAGSHTFTVTLDTAGGQSVSVADTANSSISASGGVQVSAAVASQLTVADPAADVAGSAAGVAVTALDLYGNVASGYTGTVHFTSTDAKAVLPANYTFTATDAGSHTFAAGVTFETAGSQSVTAADTAAATVTGTGGAVAVSPAAASQLTAGAPAAATAGAGFSVVVTALDPYGNVATGYTGTVHFTSTDAKALLPANYTFTAADAGLHTFATGVTLETAGAQTLSVGDTATGALSATSNGITVSPGTTSQLVITGPYSTEFTPQYGASNFGQPGPNLNAFYSMVVDRGALYAGGRVVGGSQTPCARVLRSTDGVTWTPVNIPFSTDDNEARTLFVSSIDGYMYCGTTGGTEPRIYRSPDGVNNWALVATLSPTLDFVRSFGDYKGSIYCGVTPRGTNPAMIYSTSNGTNWTVAASFPGLQRVSSFLPYNGQLLITTDHAGTGGKGGIFASSNGTTWTKINTTAFGPVSSAYCHTLTVWQNAIWVSTHDPTYGASVWRSTDGGVTWTQSPGSAGGFGIGPTEEEAYTLLAVGNTLFTCTLNSTYGGHVWCTHDGNTWTAITPAGLGQPSVYVGFFALCLFDGEVWTAPHDTNVVTNYPIIPVAIQQWDGTFGAGITTAGTAGPIIVTAEDAYGNVTPNYTGTVHFSSTDPQAVLPANYMFTASDAGVHTFTAALKTAGLQSLSAQDTATGNITGVLGGITVKSAAASQIQVRVPANAVAGTPFTVTVNVVDAFGNLAGDYTGMVQFTSTDGHAVLPVSYTFTTADGGSHTFSVTLDTAGNQAVSVADVAQGVATSTAVAVTPAAVASFKVASVAASVAGQVFSVTVTAQDAYGNTVTGYRGAVHFTSSDAQAGLPADYTFQPGDAGAHSFSVTLKTAGNQTISLADTGAPTVKGSAGVTVTAAPATQVVILAPSSVTHGMAFNFTVEVLDAYGNLATGYTGTIGFSSSDGAAALPASYTFTAADGGKHAFSATFNTVGTQSLSAQDTLTPGLNATDSGIGVT